MNNIFGLIKAAYHFRKNKNKCLKFNNNSEEYKLAKYYDDYFKKKEHEEINVVDINNLAQQVIDHQARYENSDEIQRLLTSTLDFLDVLKDFVKH